MSPTLVPLAGARRVLEVGLLFIVVRIGPRSADPSLSEL
jgi:hypothetical protein